MSPILPFWRRMGMRIQKTSVNRYLIFFVAVVLAVSSRINFADAPKDVSRPVKKCGAANVAGAFMGVRACDEPDNNSETTTAVVYDVLPDSPAELGGLQCGDRIILVQKQPVSSIFMVREICWRKKMSDELDMVVERNQSRVNVKIMLGDLFEPNNYYSCVDWCPHCGCVTF